MNENKNKIRLLIILASIFIVFQAIGIYLYSGNVIPEWELTREIIAFSLLIASIIIFIISIYILLKIKLKANPRLRIVAMIIMLIVGFVYFIFYFSIISISNGFMCTRGEFCNTEIDNYKFYIIQYHCIPDNHNTLYINDTNSLVPFINKIYHRPNTSCSSLKLKKNDNIIKINIENKIIKYNLIKKDIEK